MILSGYSSRICNRETSFLEPGVENAKAHLGDEESAHAGASSASQRVGKLETLQAVAPLRLLPERLEVKNTSNIRVLKCITSNNTWTMRRIGWK